ncbi:hypothetical protein [Prevotella histicola]|uniref:Uncharacterized protein n=1 Tax=Prevotella histicola JCM 15637 = DNF00424 TaxID=1236504 RepID=A0AAW3FIG8_9BACT|nr:hypothetical protein [Prevotella histicola]KGF29933.1 hypothetical protein HMPREF2132_01790 [Prevotella histicola JCM 15637 = DNF00424]MBF1407460.1 hypothetical protein [Prevotella histicola]DAX99146.1 MAG TPA: hypothetical protein [Caudoviricetes sp.]
MDIDTSKGLYYIVDANTDYKVREALGLARAMAQDNYPHLIGNIDFAIKMYDERTKTIASSNGKITLKE